MEFLKKATLNSKYLFAILTYGNYDGAASGHLIKVARSCGVSFSYVNTIKMVDNYLPDFDMKEQIETEPQINIEVHLDAILADVQKSKQYIQQKPIRDKLITAICSSSKRGRSHSLCKTFSVDQNCNSCKVCENVCPVNNVQISEQDPKFGENCMGCLSCVHNCPREAIHVRGEKNNGRFRNRHIGLEEIISSNQQKN